MPRCNKTKDAGCGMYMLLSSVYWYQNMRRGYIITHYIFAKEVSTKEVKFTKFF
jgi:hypothetical protein